MPRVNARSMHYTEVDVEQRLRYAACPCGTCPQQAVFYLHPEDHVWNPANPDRDVYGPGRVEYQRLSNGIVNIIRASQS